MRPSTGQSFPKIALPDAAGSIHRVPCGPTLLVFYRGHWCDNCRSQIVRLAGERSGFQQYGVAVVGISSDDASGAARMNEMIGGALLILTDNDASIIRCLGLIDENERRRVPVSLPSVFLIDDSGVVRYHYIGQAREDRPRIELLRLAAEQIARRK